MTFRAVIAIAALTAVFVPLTVFGILGLLTLNAPNWIMHVFVLFFVLAFIIVTFAAVRRFGTNDVYVITEDGVRLVIGFLTILSVGLILFVWYVQLGSVLFHTLLNAAGVFITTGRFLNTIDVPAVMGDVRFIPWFTTFLASGITAFFL